MAESRVPEDETRILMGALNFTEADLEANRGGKLSLTQSREFRSTNLRLALEGLIAVFGTLWFLNLVRTVNTAPTEALPGIQVISAVIIVVLIAITVYVIRSENQKLNAGVWCATGRACPVKMRPETGLYTYHIFFEDLDLLVSEAAYPCFKTDQPYRVYYLPHNHLIVTAEFLN